MFGFHFSKLKFISLGNKDKKLVNVLSSLCIWLRGRCSASYHHSRTVDPARVLN